MTNRWQFRMRWSVPIIRVIILLAVLLLATMIVWRLPSILIDKDAVGADFQRAHVLDEYRKTLVQVLGGLVVLGGLWYTKRNVDIAEQGRLTERMSHAIEHLGAERMGGARKTEVRLGGIMELGRLAQDSRADQLQIRDILAAYARSASSELREAIDQAAVVSSDQAEDIRSSMRVALEINSAMRANDDSCRVNLDRVIAPNVNLIRGILSNVDLSNAILTGGRFEHADLGASSFQNSDLVEADFRHCVANGEITFAAAILHQADFSDAHLRGARFNGVRCKDALFRGTDLRGARFDGAELEGTDFSEADLRGCSFADSNLTRAIFKNADASGADFTSANTSGADFTGTNLSQTIGLSRD